MGCSWPNTLIYLTHVAFKGQVVPDPQVQADLTPWKCPVWTSLIIYQVGPQITLHCDLHYYLLSLIKAQRRIGMKGWWGVWHGQWVRIPCIQAWENVCVITLCASLWNQSMSWSCSLKLYTGIYGYGYDSCMIYAHNFREYFHVNVTMCHTSD